MFCGLCGVVKPVQTRYIFCRIDCLDFPFVLNSYDREATYPGIFVCRLMRAVFYYLCYFKNPVSFSSFMFIRQ